MHRPEQVFSGFRQALAHLTLLALSSAVAHASAPPWIVQDEGQAILPAGTHAGLQIDTPLRLTCAPGALIDAGGQGHALRILASDVRVEGCTLRNWGRDLTRMDSGIFIERGAQRVHLVNNDLHGPGFGIWADRSVAVEVRNNRIQGDPSIRSQDRGNGIHLFGVTQAKIIGNQVWHTRDGIYIETAHHNRLEGNHLHDLRYGIHYMYSHSNAIINNRTERTRTGYALM
ncbi:MAG: right-handed parallel beta-helix repeat-containing protein, partial [Gammaproteobacteria bacterium]|nr:right-handed parallel beta-helix repeat-containing protein [Gammaproteobacteria bacterium]